ncbi:MAG: nuclear transport factor 2 family protein [Proteobacteria bacterium]|nr:nuclear transport factor 2 family protein [Pseudomonadota bacterium]
MLRESVVRKYYRYLCDGDSEALVALLDDDIEHAFDQQFVEVGIENFRRFLAVKHHHYQERIEDLMICFDHDTAAVGFTLIGKYINTYGGLPVATGQPYKLTVRASLVFKQEKISRIATQFDFESWLSQVKLGQ